MTRILQRRISQPKFESSAQEVILAVFVAADFLVNRFVKFLSEYGITRSQYNVLRILRGAGEAGQTRTGIASRMLDNAPDVTRILDRLVAAGLVVRAPGVEDRRTSIARITPSGLELLARLDRPVAEELERLARRLGEGQRKQLCAHLDLLYASDE